MLLTVDRYYRNKFNVTWDEDESRVSYNLDTYYVLDEDLSYGNPKDFNIITLNVPLLVSKITTLSIGATQSVRVKIIYKDTSLLENIPHEKHTPLILAPLSE